jgi:hypothetical protein
LRFFKTKNVPEGLPTAAQGDGHADQLDGTGYRFHP